MDKQSQSNDDGWTVVSYQKPTKVVRHGSRSRSTAPVIHSVNSGLQQATATSFDQGSHYIPFGNGRSESGDKIPFSTKERRFAGAKSPNDSRHLAKIDAETETFHHKMVSKDLSKKISQYRKNNNMTQQQLATKMSVGLDIVQAYEKGTAISDGAINSKFHQLLTQK
jgi:DNA-binding transcriptional regulator YiaG